MTMRELICDYEVKKITDEIEDNRKRIGILKTYIENVDDNIEATKKSIAEITYNNIEGTSNIEGYISEIENKFASLRIWDSKRSEYSAELNAILCAKHALEKILDDIKSAM